MANLQENSLEILRQRAKCSLCLEIYTQSKKSPNCSHVFCLMCMKRHFESKRPNNFPPCPLCRRPITKAFKELDLLEPARAEQDIADVVKQFETCDLCSRKENPKLKCLDCNWFVCENCEPGHSKLKPTHTVVPIMPINSSVYNRSRTSKNCIEHPNQVVDLFCIICQKVLCLHCESNTHAPCKSSFTREMMEKRYSYGFLSEFLEQRIKSTKHLPRLVNFVDVLLEARQWLLNVKDELQQCIDFLQEYEMQLCGIVNDTKRSEPLNNRCHYIQDEIDFILKLGKDIHTSILTLMETTTGIEIAESVLKIEEKCLHFFRLRRKYSPDTRPLELAMNNGFRQLSNCSLRSLEEEISRFVCIFCMVNSVESFEQTTGSQFEDKSNCTGSSKHTGDEFFIGRNVSIFKILFSKTYNASFGFGKTYRKLNKDLQLAYAYNETSSKTITCIENDLYNNAFLGKNGKLRRLE